MATVKPIPEGYPQVIPYLSVDGATAAIGFYKDVFGATERMRMPGPDGRIGHAELEIGASVLMLADVNPDMGNASPLALGGTPVTVMVYVDDVDSVFDRALSSGAIEERKIENQFYGDRSGQFTDPFGHKWYVATHVEDVSAEDMAKRAAELAEQASASS
jgi:PhnB protein